MAKTEEYRSQSTEELQAALMDLTQQLYTLKNKKIVEKTLEKPHRKKVTRRQIARVKTIMREKNNTTQVKG